MHGAIQLIQLRDAVDFPWAGDTLHHLPLSYPGLRRLQGALALNHVPDVVMVWHHDPRLQAIHDGLDMNMPHDMLRGIHRQQGNINVAQGLPDIVGRVVAVVAPMDDAQTAGLHHHQAVIPTTRVVGRFHIDAVEMLMDFLEVIDVAGRIHRMLVRQTIDGHVAEAVHADQAVEQDMGIQAVQGIVVEMGMSGDADIHGRKREIMEIPVPGARGMVAPWIDHHADPLGRGDAEGRRAVERHLHRAVLGGRCVRLQLDHPVMIGCHPPDVQPGINIGHNITRKSRYSSNTVV